MLTQLNEEEMMVYLKQKMQDGAVRNPYDREFINERNAERY